MKEPNSSPATAGRIVFGICRASEKSNTLKLPRPSKCSGGLGYQQRGPLRCCVSFLSGFSNAERSDRRCLSAFALTKSLY